MPVYKITNVGANKCLNIYGDNLTEITGTPNVTMWSDSGSREQQWFKEDNSFTEDDFLRSVIDVNCGLNVNLSDGNNCNVDQISGNDANTKVSLIATGYGFKIKLVSHNLYLTAAGSANGSNVYWTADDGSDYQKWIFNLVNNDYLGNPVTDFDAYQNLSELDLIARCIYSEAATESDQGKRGVACTLRNRKNHYRFPNSYKEVVTQGTHFSGMRTHYALAPNTAETRWKDCVAIARAIDTVENPIGTCCFFNATSAYEAKSYTSNGTEYFYLSGEPQKVVEKISIGGHVFFRLYGY